LNGDLVIIFEALIKTRRVRQLMPCMPRIFLFILYFRLFLTFNFYFALLLLSHLHLPLLYFLFWSCLSKFLCQPVSSLACYAYYDADVSCFCSCYSVTMVVLWALSRTMRYDFYFRPVYCVLSYSNFLYSWSDSYLHLVSICGYKFLLSFLFNPDFWPIYWHSFLDISFLAEIINSDYLLFSFSLFDDLPFSSI
jgi:hypothetical protein